MLRGVSTVTFPADTPFATCRYRFTLDTPDSSFERCLSEPMAIRPDDILEGVLIQFLRNLKPGLRNLE